MTTRKPANARPPLDRQVSRKSKEKAASALDHGIRIRIEGEVYEARVGDVTPELARELRANTGHSFVWLMDQIGEDPDIDLLSSFVWVARRIAGDDVAFADVSVSYAQFLSDGFEMSLPGPEVTDVTNPEG